MTKKDLNYIAAAEKAIAEKYGKETVRNPMKDWDEEKEKQYISQMKELYAKNSSNSSWQEKIDINGIKVTKKLLNKEPLHTCPICGTFPKKSMDDVCLLKFDCCNTCYIQYIEDREERWQKGWRPNLKEENE
jgi:formate dehydrogenase maturation protein FdhE